MSRDDACLELKQCGQMCVDHRAKPLASQELMKFELMILNDNSTVC